MSDDIADRILVAVDGSDSSLSGLEFGMRLWRAGSALRALIVEDLRVPSFMTLLEGEAMARLVAESEEALKAGADMLEHRILGTATARDCEVSICRREGALVDVLTDEAAWCTLLVLGVGRQVASCRLLGAGAESLVRSLHKPMILAPQSFQDPASVVVAYAAKSLGPIVLRAGAALASALQVKLSVINVDDDPAMREQTLAKARDQLDLMCPDAHYIGAAGDVVDAIVSHCESDTVLVLGAYGHSRLYTYVLGSMTARLMRAAPGPVFLTEKLQSG